MLVALWVNDAVTVDIGVYFCITSVTRASSVLFLLPRNCRKKSCKRGPGEESRQELVTVWEKSHLRREIHQCQSSVFSGDLFTIV